MKMIPNIPLLTRSRSHSIDKPSTQRASTSTELSTLSNAKPRVSCSHRLNGETLLKGETFWRDHQKWLEDRGYMLRPRYRPDWKPSWVQKDDTSSYWNYEDGQMIPEHGMMDATRICDNALVMMKRISSQQEFELHQSLLEKESSTLGKHHIVPILETLEVPDAPTGEEERIVVMPLLRPSSDPQFGTVEETIEFFRQAFEGLRYMHESRVAHGSCNFGGRNIMMDPTPLFPNMYHPVALNKSRDFSRSIKPLSRSGKKMRYFWVNFERSLSERATMKSLEDPNNTSLPKDAFAEDIYQLGIMIKENFVQRNEHMQFMGPLAADMASSDLTKRPTIDKVIERFEGLVTTLSRKQLKVRLDGPAHMRPRFWFLSARRS